MDTKWIRPYIKDTEITENQKNDMIAVFDRIYNMHGLIEDKKIAKRIYTRTHMVSIMPILLESINTGLTDKQMVEWFTEFFSGKKSPTTSVIYNSAAGRGTGKNGAVRSRMTEILKSYDKFFFTTNVNSNEEKKAS